MINQMEQVFESILYYCLRCVSLFDFLRFETYLFLAWTGRLLKPAKKGSLIQFCAKRRMPRSQEKKVMPMHFRLLRLRNGTVLWKIVTLSFVLVKHARRPRPGIAQDCITHLSCSTIFLLFLKQRGLCWTGMLDVLWSYGLSGPSWHRPFLASPTILPIYHKPSYYSQWSYRLIWGNTSDTTC